MNGGSERTWWSLSLASFLVGLAFVPASFVDRGPGMAVHSRTADQSTDATLLIPDSTERDALFRADRVRPSVRYSPMAVEANTDTLHVPERPGWRLAGIVRGVPMVALFEGIPGAGNTTRLIREGERIGLYVIESIGADTVLVSTTDSAWVFVLEAPWG